VAARVVRMREPVRGRVASDRMSEGRDARTARAAGARAVSRDHAERGAASGAAHSISGDCRREEAGDAGAPALARAHERAARQQMANGQHTCGAARSRQAVRHDRSWWRSDEGSVELL